MSVDNPIFCPLCLYPLKCFVLFIYWKILYVGDESDREIAEIIVKATGPKGSNSKYVLNLAECLRNINIGTDKANHVFAIERKIKELVKGRETFHG